MIAQNQSWLVRHAREGDALSIARLFAAIRAEEGDTTRRDDIKEASGISSNLIASPSAWAAVAASYDRVIGVVGVLLDLRPGGQRTLVHVGTASTFVASEWRGAGVGAALMVAVQDWARERRLERLEVSIRASNARSIAMCERAGFVRSEQRRSFEHAISGDEIFMSWTPGMATSTGARRGNAAEVVR